MDAPRRLLIALLPLAAATICYGQQKTWEFDNGKWPQVNDATPQPVSDPEIDRAENISPAGLRRWLAQFFWRGSTRTRIRRYATARFF